MHSWARGSQDERDWASAHGLYVVGPGMTWPGHSSYGARDTKYGRDRHASYIYIYMGQVWPDVAGLGMAAPGHYSDGARYNK